MIAEHMVAHMIASVCRDLPGVIATGSTAEGDAAVFIVMRTMKGYVITHTKVVEVEAPDFSEFT